MDQPISTPPVFTQESVAPELPKKSYTWLYIVLIAFFISVTSIFAYQKWQPAKPTGSDAIIQSYEDCALLSGSIIYKSYPGICHTASGQRFTQILSDKERERVGLKTKDDLSELFLDLPAGWTYYNNDNCSVKLPLPPKEVINTRTWQGEGWNSTDFLGFFKGSTVRAIHRNPEEASGYISGLVEVICGLNTNNLSLDKFNSDFHAYLTMQTPQNTSEEALIELTANNDIIKWGIPVKEMTFVGGMFNPNQKYYLLVKDNDWFLVTKKSDSNNPIINQQTDQIFNLLKFKE